jgi:hypothetical protein
LFKKKDIQQMFLKKKKWDWLTTFVNVKY